MSYVYSVRKDETYKDTGKHESLAYAGYLIDFRDL